MDTTEITSLVQDFANRIASAAQASAQQRIQAIVAQAFSGQIKRGPGRPPKNPVALAVFAPLPGAVSLKPRKLRVKQLCPVPGCKNPAAPVFGMVCAQHKGVPKAKIKEYREARRAAKQRKPAGGAKAAKRRRPKARKTIKRS